MVFDYFLLGQQGMAKAHTKSKSNGTEMSNNMTAKATEVSENATTCRRRKAARSPRAGRRMITLVPRMIEAEQL